MRLRRGTRSAPRVVLTLLARDEADIVGATIDFHLAAGVDLVVALDNGSTDGTKELLERYASQGRLHLIVEPGVISQEEQMTRMARMAASELEADWVINTDADEFWYPRSGTLKDVFAAAPTWVGKVHARWWHFPPRPGSGHFAERMTARLCVAKPPRYHTHVKTAHRGDPEVVVAGGNHDAFGRKLRGRRRWHPIDVLHFPLRSKDQLARKFARRLEITPNDESERYREAYDAIVNGRIDELWDSYVLSDEELERGVADGTYVIDRRVARSLGALRNRTPGAPVVVGSDAPDGQCG